MSFTRETI